MVTISITREAFAAIEATLSKGSKAEARSVGKGGLFVVLDRLARSIAWVGCAVWQIVFQRYPADREG